jgi:hypothetical protein
MRLLFEVLESVDIAGVLPKVLGGATSIFALVFIFAIYFRTSHLILGDVSSATTMGISGVLLLLTIFIGRRVFW